MQLSTEIGKCYCPNKFIQAAQKREAPLRHHLKSRHASANGLPAEQFLKSCPRVTTSGWWMVPDCREAFDSENLLVFHLNCGAHQKFCLTAAGRR